MIANDSQLVIATFRWNRYYQSTDKNISPYGEFNSPYGASYHVRTDMRQSLGIYSGDRTEGNTLVHMVGSTTALIYYYSFTNFMCTSSAYSVF